MMDYVLRVLEILWLVLKIELCLLIPLLLLAPGMLYADYAAVMNFKRVRNTVGLTKFQTVAGSYILVRGYLLDCFVNVVHMTILLLELPREITVTRRLRRHINDNTRHAALCLALRHELDPLDPSGTHQ